MRRLIASTFASLDGVMQALGVRRKIPPAAALIDEYGDIQPGSFAGTEPSAKELVRREKFAREALRVSRAGRSQ